MAKTKTKKTKANIFAWWFYTFCSKIFLWFRHGIKYDRKAFNKRNKKEGCIVLYNHCSNRDHYITTCALNYHRTNYVITKHFFFNKTLNKILNLVKAIPREQFKSDMVSIRQIKKVIEEKGIVTIAPAGQVTINGELPYVDKAAVKLLKFCNVDVYATQIIGAYLAYPKWGKVKRGFPLKVKFVKVLAKEELKTLSDDEILMRIIKSIDVNDREYQKIKSHVVKSKALAEGLESIIYYCPKCHSYYSMHTKGDQITCERCHNTIRMNKYGFLEGVGNDYVMFENEAEWYKYEKALLRKRILKGDFHLEGNYKLHRNLDGKWELEEVGSGKVVLTNDRFYYEGTIRGEFTHKDFNLDTLIQLPFSPAHHFDVPDDDGYFEFFPIDNKNQVIEFVQAIDVMREIKKDKGN